MGLRRDACILLLGLVVVAGAGGCQGGFWRHTTTAQTRAPQTTAVRPAAAELRIDTPPSNRAPEVIRAAAPTPETPAREAPPGESPLRALHRASSQQYAAMDSYIVRMRRREHLNGKDKPEEVILMKIRREPWSVHLKWLGEEGKGREVVYVKGRHDDKLHTLLARGDMPLVPAGRRMAFAPDNPLVVSASRHTIHEAGIGSTLERFGKLLGAAEGTAQRTPGPRYLGPVKRPEFATPYEAVEIPLPPGYERHLPRGGTRWLFFDPVTRLPGLVLTHDETGREVEYYAYDRYLYPVQLGDADFNPEVLWAEKSRSP